MRLTLRVVCIFVIQYLCYATDWDQLGHILCQPSHCSDVSRYPHPGRPAQKTTVAKKGFNIKLKLYYSPVVALEIRPNFLRGDLWMFNNGFAVKSPLQYWRSENYDYTLEEFYFLLMPVIRQLIASAGPAWDVRRGRAIIVRSGRDVPILLVRMTDGRPGPIAGKWILDNVRTQPRWMSWFSCRHFYVRANWFPGPGHTRGRGLGPVLHSALTHSARAQNSMGNIFYHHLLKCFNHRINSPRILS